jgi:subtilisin
MSAPSHWRELGLERITEEVAWSDATGAGVRVAVVDSGIDAGHEALAGCVKGGVVVLPGAGGVTIREASPVADDFGHGTACAGIIHRIAPDAELYSVKVLGSDLTGKGDCFTAGLRWAIENKMDVVNLSLGTTDRRFAQTLHELADQAYYAGCVLVAAASNLPPPSFPSVFSNLIAVDDRSFDDPLKFTFHAGRCIEVEAHGVNISCPWTGGGYRRVTGTSFATPHVSGLVARIRSRYPGLPPFLVKTILWSIGSRNLAAATIPIRHGARVVRSARRARLAEVAAASRTTSPPPAG